MSLWRLAGKVSLALMEDKIKSELSDFDTTPAAHLIKAFRMRQKQIEAEGRKGTVEDLEAFIEEVPELVAEARAKQRARDAAETEDWER